MQVKLSKQQQKPRPPLDFARLNLDIERDVSYCDRMTMAHDNDPLAGGATPADSAEANAQRLASLERENGDLKDRLLRALAEMENLRRRTEREMLDARAYAITKFAGDIVATADNLRRALDSLPKPAEGVESADLASMKPMIEGVELTERELLKALEKHGVKKRAPVGEKFDPHRDQAMFEIPDEAVVSGTVLQVVQPGYSIGDRVLRPAMVGVSKGGPARMAEAQPAATESAAEVQPSQPPRPPEPPRADPGARPKFDKRA